MVRERNTSALIVVAVVFLTGVAVFLTNHDKPNLAPPVIGRPVRQATGWSDPTALMIGNALGLGDQFMAQAPSSPGVITQAQGQRHDSAHVAKMAYVFRYSSEASAGAEVAHMRSDAEPISAGTGVFDGFVQCGSTFFLSQALTTPGAGYGLEAALAVSRDIAAASPWLDATYGHCRIIPPG